MVGSCAANPAPSARSLAALLHNAGKTKTEEQAATEETGSLDLGLLLEKEDFWVRDPFPVRDSNHGICLVFASLPLETV